jgi:hypothetical protein
MIVYLYFEDKKNIENCEKMYCSFYILVYFFMKNVWVYPYCGHYILFTSLWKMYKKMYSLFEWSIFKTEAIQKSHYRFKTYPYPNILISTNMNSDAPYESAVRTSLMPLMGKGAGDNHPPPSLWKVEGGKTNSLPYLSGQFSKLKQYKKVTIVSKHTLIQTSLYP